MDLDMDIPLLDELESLEANYHLYEDHIDSEIPKIYLEEEEEEDEPQQQPFQRPPLLVPAKASLSGPTSSIDPHSVPESTIRGHKRSRADSNDAPFNSFSDEAGFSEEKRGRIHDSSLETDEDWLRYSPSLESDRRIEEQIDLVAEEKTVFRYVSQIDGDFIPITAPSSGERVYAKLCRAEREERSKKLELKSQSRGRANWNLL